LECIFLSLPAKPSFIRQHESDARVNVSFTQASMKVMNLGTRPRTLHVERVELVPVRCVHIPTFLNLWKGQLISIRLTFTKSSNDFFPVVSRMGFGYDDEQVGPGKW